MKDGVGSSRLDDGCKHGDDHSDDGDRDYDDDDDHDDDEDDDEDDEVFVGWLRQLVAARNACPLVS